MQFISSSYGTRPSPRFPLNNSNSGDPAEDIIDSVRGRLYAAHRPHNLTMAIVDEKRYLGVWTGPFASLTEILCTGPHEVAEITCAYQATTGNICSPSDIGVVVWHTVRRDCLFAFVHRRC